MLKKQMQFLLTDNKGDDTMRKSKKMFSKWNFGKFKNFHNKKIIFLKILE